jgi:hypothetical protein
MSPSPSSIPRKGTVWIPVSAAARELEVTDRQVRYYIQSGLLTARRYGPRGWQEVDYTTVLKLKNQVPA